MSQTTTREVRVGLAVLLAVVGLLTILGLATKGPGFLTHQQTLDVIFRDGQGIRVGAPVRVAGIDSGRVTAIDLAEVDGALRARVSISLPAELASKLRQDVKIAVQNNITGQNCINVISSGRSGVALVPGQVVQGVEVSMFDPVLEQVGLGPVERGHLRHTIAEIRQTVDGVAPRFRQILTSLQETTTSLKDTTVAVRPAVEATAGHVEELAKALKDTAPKWQATLTKVDSIVGQADGLLTENRANIQVTLATMHDLAATIQDVLSKNRGEIDALLMGINRTRARVDRVLYQAELMTGQGVEVLTRNRANLERTFTNVRDATDWGKQLVEKLYGNPFYLSPFYKPTAEDKRASVAFDNAHALVRGIEDLSDVLKTLDAMQARPLTEAQRQEVGQLRKSAHDLQDWMDKVTRQLAAEVQNRARR
ncbi:MAG TPA: MlaD family protein [Isosphaeraceae bacterium]|jgi:phospholipid/cholesterol/gamma-HCH transport system substrate-binding protein|nr:MlaD family protein [Isosphaeraceae bacterium]